jgi:hypothetical protein
MKTLDMDLKRLVQEGKLAMEVALGVCFHPEEFRTSLSGRK